MLAFPATVIEKTIIQTFIYSLWLYDQDFPGYFLTVIKKRLDEWPERTVYIYFSKSPLKVQSQD